MLMRASYRLERLNAISYEERGSPSGTRTQDPRFSFTTSCFHDHHEGVVVRTISSPSQAGRVWPLRIPTAVGFLGIVEGAELPYDVPRYSILHLLRSSVTSNLIVEPAPTAPRAASDFMPLAQVRLPTLDRKPLPTLGTPQLDHGSARGRVSSEVLYLVENLEVAQIVIELLIIDMMYDLIRIEKSSQVILHQHPVQ